MRGDGVEETDEHGDEMSKASSFGNTAQGVAGV